MLLLIIKERWSLVSFLLVSGGIFLSPVLRNHLKPRSQKHVLDSFSQGMRSKTRWHCEIRRVTDVNRRSGTFCRLHTCTYRGRVSALRIQMSWSLLENHEQIAEPQHLQRPVIVKLRLVRSPFFLHGGEVKRVPHTSICPTLAMWLPLYQPFP